MTREALDSSSRTEVQSRKPFEVGFVYIPFPSGTLAICTDDRSHSFNDTALGAGTVTFGPGGVVTLENLNENATGQAERATLTIAGCDQTLIDSVVGDATHWLRVCIWLGYINASGALAASPPYRVFDGYLGSPTIQTGANASLIAITAETLNVALARVSQVRGCDADQQARFSTDTFFHQVSVNRARAIVVGNKSMNGSPGDNPVAPGSPWGRIP